MYEQISHSLLNKILDEIKPEIRKKDIRHFYTRLGANFYGIYTLFHRLYGERPDFQLQMRRLVEVMAAQYDLVEPLARFEPSQGQMATALGLVLLGLGTTLLVARFGGKEET